MYILVFLLFEGMLSYLSTYILSTSSDPSTSFFRSDIYFYLVLG